MNRIYVIAILFVWVGISSWGCNNGSTPPASNTGGNNEQYVDQREPCAQSNPLRNVYFGDLHVHTSLSFDCYIWELRVPPADAYGFARGQVISLPPLDENGNGTRTIQLERPLDFMAVADHSEFLAEVKACATPGSEAYNTCTCVLFRQGTFLSTIVMANQLFLPNPKRSEDICGPGRVDCPALAESVWKGIQEAAEDAYDRTSDCSFTTFVAYEYTGVPRISNYHRNVIFRNAKVPERPITYIEQPTPQGLWAELKRECLDEKNGCDVLAIPHNSNESSGNQFFVEYPGASTIDEQRQQASFRKQMEPLVEIFQHKGDSECMNGLSGVMGLPDELCNFEKIRKPDSPDCGEEKGFGGEMRIGCVSRRDFVRFVLLEGLKEEQRIGVNPYKLGIIASTDTHNATGGAVVENKFMGHAGNEDDTPQKRFEPDAIIHNPGGLVAVWAEENARNSIFDALRRRETYGTSGPRIVVRLFGGWDYAETMCTDPNFVKIGYQKGVPMGGDLLPWPGGAAKPTFAVSAMRESDFGTIKGTPLQRIQIIKGWLGNDLQPTYKVFEVAGNPDNGASVNPDTCEIQGQGFDTLCKVWTDPEFNPNQRAFYYARVVENPTCRWSAYDCNRLAPEERPEQCSSPDTTKVIQERAWTSPIWYQPAGG